MTRYKVAALRLPIIFENKDYWPFRRAVMGQW